MDEKLKTAAEATRSSAKEEEQSSKSTEKSPAPPLSRIGVNTYKAGMEGLDKTKINEIILEASKGSKYYENELQKERKVTERIDAMLKELRNLSSSQKEASMATCDRDIEQIFEPTRDLSHIIVHIDMDAFFAAVEMRDDPSLREVPMAVGGNSMLSTSNYIARRYGVRAAMPGFIAKKLCPKLVIVRSHFDKYQEVAHQVREILADYDPLFSSMGLDEACLDLTDYVTEKMKAIDQQRASIELTDRDNSEAVTSQNGEELSLRSDDFQLVRGSLIFDDFHVPDQLVDGQVTLLPDSYWQCAADVVTEIRQRIENVTQLTASAGIAVNKMLAKIASDMNKPNGQFLISPSRDEILHFVRKLPIRKICGIGKVTERMLNALGVETCQDLYDQRAVLRLLFSKCSYDHFMNICLGIGSCNVHSEWERKSISTERTFADISKPSELYQKCHQLCHSLAEEVTEKHIKGRTVTLKLKTSHFEVKQRSMSLSNAVQSFHDIHRAARSLLETEMQASPSLKLRLMGVRLSSLESDSPKKKRNVSTLEKFFPLEQETTPKRLKMDDEATDESFRDTDKMTEDEESLLNLQASSCPVCDQLITGDNVSLNQHIDECLNHSAIEEITTAPLTDGITSTSTPVMRSSTPSKVKKSKRKNQRTPKNSRSSKKTGETAIKSLHHFFY